MEALRVHLYRESYHFWPKIWSEILGIWLFPSFDRFSAKLCFEMMCLVVPTVMEAKKSHFLAWNPTPELQNLRKRQKIMKIQQKMTETTRGRCEEKVGTKSGFTKNSGKTIREEKIEKTFSLFLVFFGRFHKIFKNFQNLFFSGRNFSIFFLAAGFSRIFFYRLSFFVVFSWFLAVLEGFGAAKSGFKP